MAEPIIFEALDAAPEETHALASLPLAVYAVVADVEDVVFAYGTIPLAMDYTGAEAPEIELVIAYGEIPLAMGFTVAYEVGIADVDATIPLLTTSYVDVDAVGELRLPLDLDALVPLGAIPPGDGPVQEVEDAMLVQTSPAYDELAVAAASFGTATTVTSMASRIARQTEGLVLRDRVKAVLEAVIADAAAFDAAATGDVLVTVALVDTLRLLGAAESTVSAMAMLSDVLAVQAAATSLQEAEANDAAALTEAVDALARALEVIVSTAVFSETVQAAAVLTVLVPESIGLGDEAEALAIYQAIIDERLELAVGFTLDGVPYVGLAINATNKAVTEYDNFNFNSLAWNGRYLYGAGPAGLYRHAGDTDAGTHIRAYLRTPMQRIADGRAARVSDAYLGFRSNGTLQLKVIVNDNAGRKVGYVYDLVRAPTGAAQPGRFKVGRGLKSVYMAFELGNVDGDDFAIDVLEIRPLVLDRRLP